MGKYFSNKYNRAEQKDVDKEHCNRYMRVRNMRILSYATNLNVPSTRSMRVAALVQVFGEVW